MKIVPLVLLVLLASCMLHIDGKKHKKHVKHKKHNKHHKKAFHYAAKPSHMLKSSKKSSVYERPGARLAVNEDSESEVVDENALEKSHTATNTDKGAAKHAITKNDYDREVRPEEFKTCTDAACDESGEVDTSEWVILKKHKNNAETSNLVNENETSEKTNIESKPEKEDNNKKQALADIFSSVDSTSNNTQSGQDGMKQNKTENTVKADLKNKNQTEHVHNETLPSKKNDSVCTDAACKAPAPSELTEKEDKGKKIEEAKEKEKSTEKQEKQKNVTEDSDDATKEVESAKGKDENTENNTASYEDLSDENKAEAESEESDNEEPIKEKEKSKQTDEKDDIESNQQKTNGKIMDQLAAAVQHKEQKDPLLSNCTDDSCFGSSKKTNTEKDDTENAITDTVDEEKSNLTESNPTDAKKQNSSRKECTDAACSAAESSTNDKDVHSTNEESEGQTKSECTDAACTPPNDDEKEKTETEEDSDKETKQPEKKVEKTTEKVKSLKNEKTLKNEQETDTAEGANHKNKTECTDEACSVSGQQEKTKESESIDKSSDRTDANKIEGKVQGLNKNETKSDTVTEIDDLQTANLVPSKNSTSANDNSTECTDAACSPPVQSESEKNDNDNHEKEKDKEVSTHTATEEREDKELKNEKKMETGGSGNDSEQTEKDQKEESKNECTDAACSAEQQPKEEAGKVEATTKVDEDDNVNLVEKKKNEYRKNTTASLLPSTIKVHNDDTDNSPADNGTAEFLSEVLPKTSESKDSAESVKEPDSLKVTPDSTKHDGEKNTTCTDASCRSSSNSTSVADEIKTKNVTTSNQANSRTFHDYINRKKHLVKNVSD